MSLKKMYLIEFAVLLVLGLGALAWHTKPWQDPCEELNEVCARVNAGKITAGGADTALVCYRVTWHEMMTRELLTPDMCRAALAEMP